MLLDIIIIFDIIITSEANVVSNPNHKKGGVSWVRVRAVPQDQAAVPAAATAVEAPTAAKAAQVVVAEVAAKRGGSPKHCAEFWGCTLNIPIFIKILKKYMLQLDNSVKMMITFFVVCLVISFILGFFTSEKWVDTDLLPEGQYMYEPI